MTPATLEAPAGDHPARSRYTFTDTGSQARQSIVIASQSKTYDPADTAQLTYEAEALTPLDAAAIVTKSGAHGGASNNAVAHAAIGPDWAPMLSTEHDTHGHLTHWGTYRLYARVYATAEARVRVEYSAGDAAMRRVNRSVTVPGGGTFYMVDLGEVRLEKASVGSQQWQGAIYAYSESEQTTVGIDKLYLAPTESLTVVKARRDPSAAFDVGLEGYDAWSRFNTESGAINGDTSDSGDTWASTGDAADFSVGSGVATRTATSDADIRTGRYAVIGSSNAAQVVQADVQWSANLFNRRGVLARYTDTSNWLMAFIYAGTLTVEKRVAGTPETLGTASGDYSRIDTPYKLRLVVGTHGTWAVYVGVNGSTLAEVLSGQDSDLATGGSLASGKAGIYDAQTSASANTRTYDNFAAWVPDLDAACLSGGDVSVRWDGAWRETADSGVYAPAHVEDSHARAPASGLEGRTCRTIVIPSAGDHAAMPDLDPKAFTVASAHRGCFLHVPEA